MKTKTIAMIALLALGGCAVQTQAQINAQLARHVGQSEADLVRELGVPTRQFQTGGNRFLAYVTGHQEIDGFGGYGGFGGGFGPYGYGYGGFGGWGWGGYGPGWDFPSRIDTYRCETTFEINSGHVIGFRRHGNACA